MMATCSSWSRVRSPSGVSVTVTQECGLAGELQVAATLARHAFGDGAAGIASTCN